MERLTIITPALCRPELHSQVLPQIAAVIRSKVESPRWIVNIDPVPQDSIETTANNYRSILSDMPVSFTKSSQPCFFSAVKNLTAEAAKFNDPVFYLEDDWKLVLPNEFETLLESEVPDHQFICLTSIATLKRNLNPGLWGVRYFEHCFAKRFANKTNPEDPERVIFWQHPMEGQESICPGRIFEDVGIAWREQRGLVKWEPNPGTPDHRPVTYR